LEVNSEVRRQTTVKEAGARGGRVTRERYGIEFYRRIGRRGGKKTKALYAELLREIARRGGRPRRPPLDAREEDQK